MNIIREDARMLTEEGELMKHLRGGNNENNFKIEDYMNKLESIINKKISIYTQLKDKIDIYR